MTELKNNLMDITNQQAHTMPTPEECNEIARKYNRVLESYLRASHKFRDAHRNDAAYQERQTAAARKYYQSHKEIIAAKKRAKRQHAVRARAEQMTQKTEHKFKHTAAAPTPPAPAPPDAEARGSARTAENRIAIRTGTRLIASRT